VLDGSIQDVHAEVIEFLREAFEENTIELFEHRLDNSAAAFAKALSS
jgi:hypothetical protein